MVTTESDFEEFIELLNANNVEYLIVGAYAMAYYGVPRYTKDLDLYIRPTAENAAKIMQSLEQFGMGNVGLQATDFCQEERVIQLGVAPIRIDLVTSIPGVIWETAWANKSSVHYGDIPTFVIGRKEFVASKRACGREQDIADLKAMGE